MPISLLCISQVCQAMCWPDTSGTALLSIHFWIRHSWHSCEERAATGKVGEGERVWAESKWWIVDEVLAGRKEEQSHLSFSFFPSFFGSHLNQTDLFPKSLWIFGNAIWTSWCSLCLPSINNVFRGILERIVIAYIDNILIYFIPTQQHTRFSIGFSRTMSLGLVYHEEIVRLKWYWQGLVEKSDIESFLMIITPANCGSLWAYLRVCY